MKNSTQRVNIAVACAASLLAATTTAGRARADNCGPYVQGLVEWVNSNPDPNQERYVWFVMASNQALGGQIISYVHGRLLHDTCAGGCISGQGKVYLVNQPYGASNVQHKTTFAFKAPPEEAPKWDAPGPSMKLKFDAGNPGTLFLSGTQVSQTQCADDVMYGWEDVPAGQNPQTYPKTFYVVSFNKMTAAKKQPFGASPNILQKIIAPIPPPRPQRVPPPH